MSNHEVALKAVDSLLDQCLDILSRTDTPDFKDEYKKAKSILVCGMGGSNLATLMLRSLFGTKVPLGVVRDYDLPAWADENTFVLLSSYSGNTQETLSCARQALDRHCLMGGLTTGGALKDLMDEHNAPVYVFEPVHNPGSMPRFALGYGLFAEMAIFREVGLLGEELPPVGELESMISGLKQKVEALKSQANEHSHLLRDETVCIFSGGHLSGNGRVFAAQLNETAKMPSYSVYLPEAHHNVIESFSRHYQHIAVYALGSYNYSEKLAARFDLTSKLITKSDYKMNIFQPSPGPKLAEALEVLLYTSYLSVYLAEKRGVDPLSIPAIDFIKGGL